MQIWQVRFQVHLGLWELLTLGALRTAVNQEVENVFAYVRRILQGMIFLVCHHSPRCNNVSPDPASLFHLSHSHLARSTARHCSRVMPLEA